MLLTNFFNLKFTQAEVDFVIPNLDRDLPVCIDPFLLFKSRDQQLKELHQNLISLFNSSFSLFREGKRQELDTLIDFPEANEIGFGYSEGSTDGNGLGTYLNNLLVEVLGASDDLQVRGLKHIEELQLVSLGIGPDRVSDIAAHTLKSFLIEYTREQAGLWKIPLTKDVPVYHVFDFKEGSWEDGYFNLPWNPVAKQPILLVPRRIVRLLPWINFNDYAGTDFRLFLRPSLKRSFNKSPKVTQTKNIITVKREIVRITRNNLPILDKYIARKERESSQVLPIYFDKQDLGLPIKPLARDFGERLKNLPNGTADSKDYQRLVYEIMNYLFEPELTNGEMEVKTIDGTERRDLIYTNESESSFWQFLRLNYGSPFVMFEVKNVAGLEIEHINQTATYLGARLGTLGFIVTRNPPADNIVRKIYSVFNDTQAMPRKLILVISDDDLNVMLQNKDNGTKPSPTGYLQNKYRDFCTTCQ